MHQKRLTVIAILIGGVLLFGAASLSAQGPQPRSEPAEGLQAPALTQLNLGTGFTYQGQLKNGGIGVSGNCDFLFALYDAQTLGARIGATQTVGSLAVLGGLFTTLLDFGQGAFDGNARFLNIQARCPAGGGAYTALAPRQPLTPVPYALALPGVRTEQGPTTTNIIAGAGSNRVTGGAIGATIAGGGDAFYSNTVTGTFGTVGGGQGNRALGLYATVGGGGGNAAGADSATVSGGYLNLARGSFTVIGGGQQNFTAGSFGTVSGGAGNQTNGTGATVPGGLNNAATGDFSFAAGLDAYALHAGAFVWADSTSANGYDSTAPNQFAIRATGGVSLAVAAGPTKTVQVGERYRDNAIVAWAKIDGPSGLVQNTNRSSAFGIASSARYGNGEYGITTTVSADNALDLIPIAIAELEALPINSTAVRIVSVNQINPNYFEVYINSGTGALTDNDFVVMVTAR